MFVSSNNDTVNLEKVTHVYKVGESKTGVTFDNGLKTVLDIRYHELVSIINKMHLTH